MRIRTFGVFILAIGAAHTAYGQLIHTLPTSRVRGAQILFSPRQNLLATWGWRSGSNRPRVFLVNPSSGKVQKRVYRPAGDSQPPQFVAFSPVGATMAIGGSTLELWSSSAGRIKKSLIGYRHPDPILTGVFSPDGKLLATVGTLDKFEFPFAIKIWDTRTGKVTQTIDLNERIPTPPLAFSPDNRGVLSVQKQRLVCWDARTGVKRFDLGPIKWPYGRATENAVSFNHDASKVICTNFRETSVWSIPLRRTIFAMASSKSEVKAFHTQPGHASEGIIVEGRTDGLVRKIELSVLQSRTLPDAHSGRVTCIAFSQDGRLVATGSEDWNLKIWDVHSEKLLATLKAHNAKIDHVAFSFDDRKLATSSHDQTVKIWNVEKLVRP